MNRRAGRTRSISPAAGQATSAEAAGERPGVRRVLASLALVGGTALLSDAALAQGIQSEYFQRDRSVSVAQRQQPEYSPLGIPMGSYVLFPQLDLSAGYSDNIYASRINPENDAIFSIRPQARVESRWNRHSVRLQGQADIRRYAQNTSENVEDWSFDGGGRFEVSRSDEITFGASIAQRTQPRTSPESFDFTTKPVRYLYKEAEIGAEHVFNRMKVSASGSWEHYNYNDSAVAGGIFNQDDRDRRVLSASGTIDYAIGPRVAAFVEGRYNDRSYDPADSAGRPPRDSNGYEVLGGLDFELTDFLRGVVGAGYLSQRFDDPAYEDFSGWSADARLEWFPTLLTTVTATLRRDVGDSGIVGAGGYLTTNAGLRVDHELLRNLVLDGAVGRSRFKYKDIDRDDRRWYFQGGATFRLNRNYGARLEYVHEDQNSVGSQLGQEYIINRVLASIFVRI